jgi:hypothetical protein
MKIVGYVLIVFGFLAAAYVTVVEPLEVEWGPFFALLALGALGVALVRFALHKSARHEEVLTTNLATLESSLARLAAGVEGLEERKADTDVYDLRHRIDAAFREDLATFADARESIAVSYGLPAFAEVMNHFAAGERYLARVWSASTDGYADEAHDYLERARDELAQALQTFRGLKATPIA